MPGSPLSRLYARLERLHMTRIAVVYLVAAWAVIEVSATVLPALHLPGWLITAVVVAALVGFPLALIGGWYVGSRGEEGAAPGLTTKSSIIVVVVSALLLIGVGVGLRFARSTLISLGVTEEAPGGAGVGVGPNDDALDPDRIVVAPFVNETSDTTLDAFGRLAADWITQGLGETGFGEVVSGRTVREVGSKDSPGDLARALGAATVVEGAFYRDGPHGIAIEARIVDVETNRVLRAVPAVHAEGPESMTALTELRQRAMAALASLRDPRAGGVAAHASQPPTFEAYREYATGEELFIRRDWDGAIHYFERAHGLDSAYTLPLIWAAIAEIQRRRPARADSIVAVLSARRVQLAPMDLAMLDWLIAYLRGDAVARYEAVKRQRLLSPGSEADYQFALEALRLGHAREAIASSEKVNPALGAMSGRYAYWNTLTGAHHLLGQHRRELSAARRGVAQYPNNLHTLLYETRALAALGREADVQKRLDAALSLQPLTSATAGLVLETAAVELRAHGHAQAGQRAGDRALAWYLERASSEPGSVEAQHGLARAFYLNRRWRDAERSFSRLAGRDSTSVEYLGYLGVLAARQASQDRGRAISEQLARIDPKYQWGEPTVWRARIAALLGNPVGAVALLRAAAAEGYRYAWDHHSDQDFESLRDYPPFRTLIGPRE